VRAAYAVDGTRYEVADSRIGSPNPDWDTVRVGDSVTVYYDPAIPARAVLCMNHKPAAWTEPVSALVERGAEPAREGGGELLFHAVILCGRGRSAEC